VLAITPRLLRRSRGVRGGRRATLLSHAIPRSKFLNPIAAGTGRRFDRLDKITDQAGPDVAHDAVRQYPESALKCKAPGPARRTSRHPGLRPRPTSVESGKKPHLPT